MKFMPLLQHLPSYELLADEAVDIQFMRGLAKLHLAPVK